MKTSQIFRAAYKENNKSWDDCQAFGFGQKAEAGQGLSFSSARVGR
jgi:hypothetical protein